MSTAVQPPGPAYRFGPFHFQPGSNRLQKQGVSIRMERKPLLVLTALLERPGQVVSREELQHRLWPQDTFVDFELGLRVAVNKLREALSDEADKPRYIETVVGEGYRFIAAVETPSSPGPVPEPQSATGQLATAPGSLSSSVESAPHRPAVGPARLGWSLSLGAAALVLLAAVGLLWKSTRPAPPLAQDHGWVLITSVENRTGNPVLDGTLGYALERELSNSRFVRVVPRQRIQDVLRLMRKPLDAQLDAALGREVSLRDGDIQAMLTGRVEKLGSSYVLSVQVVDPARGVTLASFSEEDPADTELAAAVRRLSSQVRQALGEAPQQIQESVAQLEKVTTPSLEALQLYSRANSLMVRSEGQWSGQENAAIQAEAALLLQQSLAAEPDFASAHLLLAWALVNLGRHQESAVHFRRALALAGTVSERERLFIQGSYYHVAGDWERARQAYESLLALYPDDFWTVNNLVHISVRQQNIRRASELMVRRADLRPKDFQSNFVAWRWLANHKQRQRAGIYYQRALALASPEIEQEQPGAFLELEGGPFSEAWGRADYEAAAAEAEKLKSKAKLRTGDLRQATIGALCGELRLLGQLHEGERWAELILDPRERAFAKGDFPEARGDVAAMRVALLEQVRLNAQIGPNTVARLARVGLVRQARSAMREIVNYEIPADHDFPLGEIALAEGRLPEAVARLSAAVQGYREHHSQYQGLASMALAKVLERQGKIDQAILTLATALESEDPPVKRDVQLQLARLYRTQHRPAEAEKLEQEVLQSLAYADPDHPLLRSLQRPAGPEKTREE